MKKESLSSLIRLFINYWVVSSFLLCSGFAIQGEIVRGGKETTLSMIPSGVVTTDALQSLGTTYNTCLDVNPILTKSVTAFTLCSVGDIVAQTKQRRSDINWGRVCRFALKGLGSSLIWNYWYETVDDVVINILHPLHEIDIRGSRIIVTMLLEQFLFSPIVFGTWDIPIATLLNGANINAIPSEVRNKLGGLLWSNAMVWTPANIIIYSIPSTYRIGFSNLIDILWQSIVAEVAADCGIEKVKSRSTLQSVNVEVDSSLVS